MHRSTTFAPREQIAAYHARFAQQCNYDGERKNFGTGGSMGQVIGCRCICCSYTANVAIGGTRNAPREEQIYPVFCKGCHSITISHYYPGPLGCLDCGSSQAVAIDDPAIYAGDGDAVKYHWRGIELPTTRRALLRVEKQQARGWRRIPRWILRKLEGPEADYESVLGEVPDYVPHTLTNGRYLCPRCCELQLRFPPDLCPVFYFD